MLHNYEISGTYCKLRPVTASDAQFIVNIRNDPNLNRFLNEIHNDATKQSEWLEAYFARHGDYYFVVESTNGAARGLISLYDVNDLTGEWGRWIVNAAPTVSVESSLLIYKFAFEIIGLDSVYCRTVATNVNVISFHDSCGLARRSQIEDAFLIRGNCYDAIEHSLSKYEFPKVAAHLEKILRLSRERR